MTTKLLKQSLLWLIFNLLHNSRQCWYYIVLVLTTYCIWEKKKKHNTIIIVFGSLPDEETQKTYQSTRRNYLWNHSCFMCVLWSNTKLQSCEKPNTPSLLP